MAESTYISFYVKTSCIRIYKQSVRAIGMPRFIRFRISPDASSIILEPFDRITLTSFRVPPSLDKEEIGMEVYSKSMVDALAQRMGWNKDWSYRVLGTHLAKQNVVLFDLNKAELIPADDR